MNQQKGINRRTPVNVTDSLRRRFWNRVDKGEPGECWNWNAAMRNGYGAIKHERQVLSAHRLAYILTHGEPDASLVVGHKCDNRACCNPSHLEAITPGKNSRDARGRATFHMPRGEDAYNAVLNDGIVREIRKLRAGGLGPAEIARRTGVRVKNVQDVVSGRTWRHVNQNTT